MNVLTDEIEDIAESIKLRMIARGGTWAVHVGDDGKMLMDRVSDGRRLRDLPEESLVGRYTKVIPTADIKDDLVYRMREIRQAVAA